MRKKILVTGANGYTASLFVSRYFDEYEVVALLREGSALRDDLKELVSETYFYDGTVESVYSAAKDCDSILHLAAYFTKGSSTDEVSKLVDDNIVFTVNLLEAVSLIPHPINVMLALTYTSYDSEWGEKPLNAYSATKLAIEKIARSKYGLNIGALVLADTFGPEDNRPKIHNLIRDKKIDSFMSPFEQEMNLTHTYDVLRAFVRLDEILDDRKSVRGFVRFELLPEENYLDLEELKSLMGVDYPSQNKVPLTSVPRPKNYLPGFTPQYPVREWLRSTVLGGVS